MSLHPQTGSAPPRQASISPYRFGKYTLLTKLAQGGMGEVFAALLTGEAGFEKLVVIKRILPHLAEDPRFVSMFLTEARVTASLTHPNICQVFELGQIDGEYYLAMEYLEGVSLSRLIRQNVNRGLDLRIAAGILCQTLEGLQFAHCFRQPGRGIVGVIHRDMSPSNVFVTSAGLVKVLDFGVAKVSQNASSTATGLKGKYPYMAPEQIRGQELDGRADLFAVGVLLYEAVTGRSLFHRNSDFETLMAVVAGERIQASQLRPDIPLGLEEVIDRSLSVTREERYASAREMSEALARALEPATGSATSRELAELVRRDCADDLEDERDRIHHATTYLKSLSDRGQEPPAFMNRRARPVMALPAPEQTPGRPSSRSDVPEPGTMAPTTIDRPAAIRASRRSRVVIPLVLATALAGSVGWLLRGQPHSPPGPTSPDSSENAFPRASAGPLTQGGSPTMGGATPVPAGGAAAAPGGPADPADSNAAGGDPASAEKAGRDDSPSRDDDAKRDDSSSRDDAAKRGVSPSRDDAAKRGDSSSRDDAAKRGEGGSRSGADSDDDARPAKTRRSSSARRAAASSSTENGFFSIDSSPYAQIYIDGSLVGITPLLKVALKPGRHSVQAVAEGGATERFSITIRPGETTTKRIRMELLRP